MSGYETPAGLRDLLYIGGELKCWRFAIREGTTVQYRRDIDSAPNKLPEPSGELTKIGVHVWPFTVTLTSRGNAWNFNNISTILRHL
ncbi:hypothetical protein ABKN59_010088 [Abortiporus biennis]